jgi:hypothetical protein
MSEGEDDDEYLVHSAKNEEDHLRLPPDAAQQARAAREHREQMLRDQASKQLEASRSKGQSQSQGQDQDKTNKSNSQDREQGGSESVAKKQAHYDPSLRIDPLASSQRFDRNMSQLDERNLKKLNEAVQAAEREYGPRGDEDEDEDDQGGRIDQEDDYDGDRVVYVDHFRAPAGKRIAMPIRMEPKVVFAAERTFLKVSPIYSNHSSMPKY